MHRFYAVLLLIVSLQTITTCELWAKNYIIDDLERKLQHHQADSAAAMVLFDLVKNTMAVDTSMATKYSQMAMSIARNVADPRIKALAFCTDGILHESYYRHEKALKSFYEALDLISGNTDPFSMYIDAVIKFEIGNSYLFRGNVSSAVQYYLETQNFFEENQPDNTLRVFLYINMANAYYLSGMRQKGIMYSTQAVDLAEKLDDKRAQAHAYVLMANIELDAKTPDLDAALSMIQKAKLYGEELNDYIVIGLFHSFQSTLQKQQGNYSKALQESEQSVQSYLKIHHYLFAGEEMISIAQIEMERKNFAKAFKNYLQAMQLGDKVSCAFVKRDALKGLGQSSAEYDQMPAALNYYRLYQKLNDSISEEAIREQIFIAESQQQTYKQQKQIAALLKEKEVQHLQLLQKGADNRFLVSIIISTILISTLSFLYIRGKQKIVVQQNELQQKQIMQFEKDRKYIATYSLLQGQEEERSRIARDIHDGLGSMLSSAKHALSSVQDNLLMNSDSVQIFNRSLDLIDSSMKELRRVAHNMMPEALVRFGLKEALQDFFGRLNNKKFVIEFITVNLENRLDSAKEICVYRIVQELVTNTLKHAAASKVLVQLIQNENQISLTVEDNGIGFNTEILQTSKGAGWTNIYNRVDYLNGTLEIESQPTLGTSVTIEFHA